MSIYDDDIEKAIEALKAYNEKRNSTPTPKREPLTVYGDGSQTRSLTYVSDLVDGIYRLIRSNLNEPVNIGNPTEFTIVDFAKLIIKLTGSQSRITYEALPVDDPKQRRPNIGRAKELLGWEPKVGLEAGLRQTIEYFRDKV